MKENQAILKLTEEGILVRSTAQAQSTANTSIWNAILNNQPDIKWVSQ